ncbi:2271_t:CDS:2 [Entrophospora sp. SA101]|nr:2271_t:CDS:2 [Entrophospora sp. SA101]
MNNHKKISTQASNHDEQFATESRVFQELREIKSEIKEVKKFLIANSLRHQAREKEVAEWDEIQAQDEAQINNERIAELEAITNRTAKQEAELTSKKQELAELEKQQTQDHKKTNRTPWLIGGGIVLFINVPITSIGVKIQVNTLIKKLADEELAKRQRKEEKRRIELARGYLTEIGNYHIFRKVIEEAEEKGTLESY